MIRNNPHQIAFMHSIMYIMKYLLTFMLLIPLYCQSQGKIEMAPYHPKMARGKIDSMDLNVKCFKNQFQHIDPVSRFYIVMDTVSDSLGYEIGLVTVNSRREINEGQRVGWWKSYYQDGTLKAEGSYSMAAVTFCMAVGPYIAYYGYKSGKWIYYHPGGKKNAEGIYTQVPEEFETSCGGDAHFISRFDQNWKFWDQSGKTFPMTPEIEKELNGF